MRLHDPLGVHPKKIIPLEFILVRAPFPVRAPFLGSEGGALWGPQDPLEILCGPFSSILKGKEGVPWGGGLEGGGGSVQILYVYAFFAS